jgi:hypothetical protein
VRQLYTDQDEVLFDAARPVILNGIEDVVTRPDLADRGLFVTLPSISEAQRRPEKELWREFELSRPRILGALLDAASRGLRALPRVHLDRLPRMADFAFWAAACETALWPVGTFSLAYAANRRAAIEDAIEADPVAACVRALMAERGSWTGSAAVLLRVGVDPSRTGSSTSHADWPKNPRALGGRLRRAQTFLRALGIEMAFAREGRAGSRVIRMWTTLEDTVSAVSGVGPNGSRARSPQPTPGPAAVLATTTAALVRLKWNGELIGQLLPLLTVLTQTPPFVSGDWN